MGGFERWSYEHLGQWHYVIGYAYVLLAHNWPLFLSGTLCLWWGWQLYSRPSRSRVCLFFGALLLGLSFEYNKHVAPTLQASLAMVLWREAGWLSGPVTILVGPTARLLLSAAVVYFFGQGLWLKAAGRAVPHRAPRAD